MTRETIIEQIRLKQSFLCVGLDPDPGRLPLQWRGNPTAILPFCAQIIDATRPYCVAYKVNIAFFEALGRSGWELLYKVRSLLPSDTLLIADAKRGDIGNTSRMYARAFFDELDFDAITVAPYMGEDSVMPFLEHTNKWTILLTLTSNHGSSDFQLIADQEGTPLFERVIQQSQHWGTSENLMFVTGATHPDYLARIRQLAPDHFLLIPGVGAQGGNLDEVVQAALTEEAAILVNSSREILYASGDDDFAISAGHVARSYRDQMATYLRSNTGG